MISIAYSLISPGTTGFRASRVSGCHGFHGFERFGSSRAMRGLQPAAGDLALGQIVRHSRVRLRARVITETSGPTSFRMTIQLVSS